MITKVNVNDGQKTPVKQPEHKLVRTDSSMRTLDSFISPQPVIPSQVLKIVDFNAEVQNNHVTVIERKELKATNSEEKVKIKFEIVDVQLISVLELRQSIENMENSRITEIFREHTFVGIVDDFRALIQHQTRLLMINFTKISRMFFYQVVLYGFANFSRISFDNPLNISELLVTASTVETQNNDAESISNLLIEKREMLEEYFAVDISSEGDLISLPVLLKGYTPNLGKLPEFLISMANNVNNYKLNTG